MNRILFIITLAALGTFAHAGPWPTDDITTTHVDSASDDPSQARAEIYTTMQRVKDIIGAKGSASGVAPLDASALVPLANIPSTLTGKSADTLDGINSTSFARVDAASNFTTAPTISSNTVWHAGNDGAGSGLDADTYKGSATIAVANGGTGGTTASAARTNLGAAASGANSDITSLTGITGAVTSTKACATGYTRNGPNFCLRTENYGMTSVIGCTAVASPDAGATAIVVKIEAHVGAANAVGFRSVAVVGYPDSGCAGYPKGGVGAEAYGYEFTALAGSPYLGWDTNTGISALPLYLKMLTVVSGAAQYAVIGYYD